MKTLVSIIQNTIEIQYVYMCLGSRSVIPHAHQCEGVFVVGLQINKHSVGHQGYSRSYISIMRMRQHLLLLVNYAQ